MVGIYKITSPTSKVYIGQSSNIKKRFTEYAKLRCKGQPKLYNSLKKYGVDSHFFEILEECTVEELNDREIYWGLRFNTLEKGLNFALGNTTQIRSKETCRKISEATKGRIPWNKDKTEVQIYSEERNYKISKARKGNKYPNSGANISKSHIETGHTPPSQKNTVWICNGNKRKRVKQVDVASYLNLGWIRGKKINNSVAIPN